MSPDYLTIIAAPNAIPMSYEDTDLEEYVPADSWDYSHLDDEDESLDLAVGRIFSVTISDISSYIARSLFYDEILVNDNDILVLEGTPSMADAARIYAIGQAFSTIGYDTTTTFYVTYEPENWENKFYIEIQGHGSPFCTGICGIDIPYLDNPFVHAQGCSTCKIQQVIALGSSPALFCAQVIRNGGIGFVGTTDVTMVENSVNFLGEVFAQGSTIGKAFMNSRNFMMARLGSQSDYSFMQLYKFILIGDPALKISTTHTFPKPQLNFLGANSEGGRDYELIIPVMRIDIPQEVRDLCVNLDWINDPHYFTTAFQLDFYKAPNPPDYQFVVRFASFEDFDAKSIGGDWKLYIENTNDGEYLWIVSPLSSDNYFSTETVNEFVDFSFTISLYQ